MNIKSLLSITLAATLSMAGSAFADDKIRLATEGAYPPYNFMDDQGKLAGYEIDLGNALCKEMEVECEWVVNEWDSLIPNLVAGHYDIIMSGMSITDERKKTIAFSKEYLPVDPSLYVVAKGVQFDWSKLEGKSIGVQTETIQSAFAEEKYGKSNIIRSYDSVDQTIAELMAGNLDIVLADKDILQPIVDASEGTMEFAGPVEIINGGMGVGIGMRQNAAELHQKINKALVVLKKNGQVDQLIAQYFEGKGPFYKMRR